MPEPFQFSTRLSLREATGLRVLSVPQLARALKTVPGSVIFHHTHHYLQQHQSWAPEPPNDFAYWVTEVLGEKALGEQLASIDTVQVPSIRALREQLLAVLERAVRTMPGLSLRVAPLEEALHLVKAVSVVLPTAHRAATVAEFADALEAVTISSLYFHMFEARLRLERGGNDFSRWFAQQGETALAQAVSALDPYTHTMEDLRRTILRLVRDRVHAGEGRL